MSGELQNHILRNGRGMCLLRTAISVSSSNRNIISGTPTWLFKFPNVFSVLYFFSNTAAIIYLLLWKWRFICVRQRRFKRDVRKKYFLWQMSGELQHHILRIICTPSLSWTTPRICIGRYSFNASFACSGRRQLPITFLLTVIYRLFLVRIMNRQQPQLEVRKNPEIGYLSRS